MKTTIRRNTSAALVLALSALFLALPAGAAGKAATVALPAGDLAATFATAVYPNNGDGTLNGVIAAASGGGALAVATAFVPRSVVDPAGAGKGAPVQAIFIGTDAAKGAVLGGRVLDLMVRKGAGGEEARVILAPLASPYGQAKTLEDAERQAPGLTAAIKAAWGGADPGAAGWEFRGRRAAIRYAGDAIAAFDAAFVKEADKRPLDAAGNPRLYPWAGARNIGE